MVQHQWTSTTSYRDPRHFNHHFDNKHLPTTNIVQTATTTLRSSDNAISSRRRQTFRPTKQQTSTVYHSTSATRTAAFALLVVFLLQQHLLPLLFVCLFLGSFIHLLMLHLRRSQFQDIQTFCTTIRYMYELW